jgi:hypothetical protein
VNLVSGRRPAVKLFLIPSHLAKQLSPQFAVSLKSERATGSGNARKVDDARQEAAAVTRKGAGSGPRSRFVFATSTK